MLAVILGEGKVPTRSMKVFARLQAIVGRSDRSKLH
jgi:hypothetical protein